MLRLIWSKTLTNDLEVIVTGDACEIGGYMVVHVNIIKIIENVKYLNLVPS